MLLKSEAGLINIQSGIFGKQFSINFNFDTYIYFPVAIFTSCLMLEWHHTGVTNFSCLSIGAHDKRVTRNESSRKLNSEEVH